MARFGPEQEGDNERMTLGYGPEVTEVSKGELARRLVSVMARLNLDRFEHPYESDAHALDRIGITQMIAGHLEGVEPGLLTLVSQSTEPSDIYRPRES